MSKANIMWVCKLWTVNCELVLSKHSINRSFANDQGPVISGTQDSRYTSGFDNTFDITPEYGISH